MYLEVLRSRLGPGRHIILELGVGGGHLLSHLTAKYDAVAVDLSQKMLALSHRLNPTVQHHLGDMRSIRLNTLFDAVLIHDAIDYMLTEADVAAALATARTHLNPRRHPAAGPGLVPRNLPRQAHHDLASRPRRHHFRRSRTPPRCCPRQHHSRVDLRLHPTRGRPRHCRTRPPHHRPLPPRYLVPPDYREAGFRGGVASPCPPAKVATAGTLFVGVLTANE